MPVDRQRSYDVIVAGGGSAGVAAAVAARDAGARVLLVERYGMLGGAATVSSVLTYCGFFTQAEPHQQVVRGVGDRVLTGLRRLGLSAERHSPTSGNHVVVLDPEAVKRVLDNLVTDAGVDVWFHHHVVAASHRSDRIVSVTAAGDNGSYELGAKAFVDATGNTNLAYLADAATEQPAAGVPHQASTTVMRIGGIDRDAPIGPSAIQNALTAGAAESPVPLPRNTGVAARLPGSGDVMTILADVQFDPFCPERLSQAEITGRQLASAYLVVLREHLPGAEHAYLVNTGPRIGIREGRRLVGRERVVYTDVRAARKRSDGVARGAWPMETHPEPGRSHYESVGDQGWYSIPLGALVSATYDNLFSGGRTASADREAFSSLRVMGTAFASGHAAGAAAAIYASGGGHNLAKTQELLLQQDALI